MSAPTTSTEAPGGGSTGRLPRLAILWSFARPHRRALAAGLGLALVGSAGELASPLVTKWVLDSLAGSAGLLQPVLLLSVLTLVGAFVFYRQAVLLGTVGERVVLDARRRLVGRYLRAGVGPLTSRPSGELVTRATSDSVLLREAAASSVIGLINGAVMLVGTLVLMGVLDLLLLGTTVLALGIVTALFLLLMPGIAKAQEQAQSRLGDLGGTLEGTLRAFRTVKASRAEGRAAERIDAHARASAEHGIRSVRREGLAWSIAFTGLQVAIITILGLGAWRVGEGAMEVSTLVAFLLYAFGLFGPIMELSTNVTTLQSGMAAAARIRETEAIEAEEALPGESAWDGEGPDRAPTAGPVDGGAAVAMRAPEKTAPEPRGRTTPGAPRSGAEDGPILELRGVTAAYGPGLAPAVSGVDLVVPRRGHVALVGPSGAGKTTLLSLILRFLEPRAGELVLDGRPYGALRHADVRERLAYVEQESPVVPGTIRENLTFTHPDASDGELRAVLEEVQLDAMVDALPDGLDTDLTATSVSGGQRQRVALARAVLRAPDLLLLDEATAQVDALTEQALHRCVRRRAREGAVVTVAHRLSTVLDADEIVVMEHGGVRARGTHEQLLAGDDLYRELVEALRIAAEPPVGAEAGERRP